MNFKPISDRILVEKVEKENKTAGGILLPDSQQEGSTTGVVRAVGTGKTSTEGKTTPMTLKEGDTVMFGSYTGTQIKVENKEYLVMHEEEVLGVMQ